MGRVNTPNARIGELLVELGWEDPPRARQRVSRYLFGGRSLTRDSPISCRVLWSCWRTPSKRLAR